MKTDNIQLRLSLEQKEAIRSFAIQAGMDMSEWVLKKIFGDAFCTFISLLAELKTVQNKPERRYVLNELSSFLMRISDEDFIKAIEKDPNAQLDEFCDNYVAAMIEEICFERHLKIPEWIVKREGLKNPYFGSDLISLRLYLLTSSPPAFRKRNIFIDATSKDLL